MKKFLLLPVLLLCFVPVFAQPKDAGARWVKFESVLRGYGFMLPEGYFAYQNKKTGDTFLSSYRDDVSINIRVIGSFFPREYLKGVENKFDMDECKYDYYTMGPYVGKFFTCENREQFSRTIFLASDNTFFKITVGALSGFEKNVTVFLASLRLRGSQLFPTYNGVPSVKTEDKVVLIADLKSDPIAELYLNKPDNENIKWGNSGNQKQVLIDANTPVYSRDLIILKSEVPKFPKKIAVSVKVKVHFLTTGQIENVEVLSSTSPEYSQKVIESLKEMKFIPAQLAGKDVDVTRVMEFGYNN
jgi:hypothetical protein